MELERPGFAPAMDDRGTAVWRGVAIGCGALSVLGFGSMVSGCVVLMVWLSGLAGGSQGPGPTDPVATEPVNDDRASDGDRVVVRVTGTEGVRFSGDVGTLDETRSVAGTAPREYEVMVDPDAPLPDTARAYLARDYDDESRGRLGVEIVHDGRVVRQTQTTAHGGTVSANWIPGDSPKGEAVTVRVTGTRGLKVPGNVGSFGESRAVEGTVPQSYEVRLDADDEFDSATAYLYRDRADESPGTARVEMVHESRVVRRSELSGGGGGSVSLNWSPGEY